MKEINIVRREIIDYSYQIQLNEAHYNQLPNLSANELDDLLNQQGQGWDNVLGDSVTTKKTDDRSSAYTLIVRGFLVA